MMGEKFSQFLLEASGKRFGLNWLRVLVCLDISTDKAVGPMRNLCILSREGGCDKIRLTKTKEISDMRIFFTQHASRRLLERDLNLRDVMEVLEKGKVIEEYPEDERGPCWLSCGKTSKNYLHVVWAEREEGFIIITMYKPSPKKWETPYKRRNP